MKYENIRVCIEYDPVRSAYAAIESYASIDNRSKISIKCCIPIQHRIYSEILKDLNMLTQGKL